MEPINRISVQLDLLAHGYDVEIGALRTYSGSAGSPSGQ